MPESRSEPAPTLDEGAPPDPVAGRRSSPAAPPARSGLHPRRRRRGRPPGPGDPDPGATLAEHRTLMLRTARRVSACEDDAHDAVQAASERYLRHADRVEAETRIGWLVTVARNEALRVRQNRRLGEVDADDRPLASPSDGPEERAARADEIAEAREALSRLKPQERQALWLQASGLSYTEIAEALGWTSTKVNRNIAEGRASLRLGVESIAAGEQCAAAAPRIERLVAGEADRDDLRALRAHVRRCAPCRARLRRARGGRMLFVPPVLLGWVPWAARSGGGIAERTAPFLPASVAGLTDVGVAATAGLATIALAGGVAIGGAGLGKDDPPRRPATTAAAAAAGPRSTVLSATSPAAPQAAVRYVGARTRAAEAAEAERRRRARVAARARDREADRRAARRRAARRAAERARLSAGSAATGRATPAPASPTPTTAAPATATPAPAAPSGGSGSSGSGGSSSGGGSAAGEFGFE